MTWPLPQPADIAAQYSAALQAAFPGADATSDDTGMGVMARTHGTVGFAAYLYQRTLADELMPDTAYDWLQRHADLWGVPRIQPAAAIGSVVFSGPAGMPLPAAIEIAAQDGSGTQWVTGASAVFGAGNTATVAVTAEAAGAAGNAVAGTLLSVVSPVPGLQLQTVTVAAGGLAGGAPIEDFEAWRARVIARIRLRGGAGSTADYIEWAQDAGAVVVAVVPDWVGPGSLGVIIAQPGAAGAEPVLSTPSQVAAVQAAIDLRRPVTAQAVVVAAVDQVVPVTLALNPDTVLARSLASSAIASVFAGLQRGGSVVHSRLEDAVLQTSGSAVEIILPAADVAPGRAALIVPGAITFVAYT